MKKILAVILMALFISVSVIAGSVSLSIYPDDRAPSIALSLESSWQSGPLIAEVTFETSAWTYIGPPPTGYGPTFYVVSATPSISWVISDITLSIETLFQYRTNLPNKIIIAPKFSATLYW